MFELSFDNLYEDYFKDIFILDINQDYLLEKKEEYYIYKKKPIREPFLKIVFQKSTWNPFDTACLWNNFICVGIGDIVYLVNIFTRKIIKVHVDFYFGYFYEHTDHLYITSGTKVYCLNSECKLIWVSEHLAVDGVIINSFTDSCIIASCELDPPDGWIEKTIEKNSGKIIEKSS